MRFRDFHINVKIRIIESFLSNAIGGMVFPFMAIYLAAHFSTKLTGALLIINVIIGATTNFIGGYYADLIGRKKLMVLAEVTRFFAFGTMAIANSPWVQMPILTFFMMTINSICWGLAGPAGQAMLIDVSTPEQRKYMFSISYWATNFSIAIGSILGGFFFKSYLFELMCATSVAALIIAVMVIFFIKESYVPDRHKIKAKANPFGLFSVYKRVLKDRMFVLFFIAGTLLFTMEMHLTNYIGIHLSHDMPKQHLFFWAVDGINTLGILRTFNTILVVLTSLYAIKVIARFQDKHVLIVGMILFVAGYSVISYFTNIWVLLIAMLIATVGEVIRVPIQENYMAAIPPEDARSSYMAVNGLSFNGASLITSLFVSISAFLTPLWVSMAIFIVGALGIVIFVLIAPQLDAKKSETEKAYKTVS
ncbi:MAG: MDR family MFS transporter [Tuberibacillus sp.]